MTCFTCKGHLENKPTTFMVDIANNSGVENNIIIVKNVPSQVCKQCGEVSYDNETAEQLERIVNTMRKSITEIAVVNYTDKVVA